MDARQKFKQAIQLREQGKFEEALSHLKELDSLAPKSINYLLTIGDIYLKLNRESNGLECFRRAIQIEPEHEMASLSLFHALWDLDLTEEALAEIRRFQEVSHSDDYVEIIRELHDTWVKDKSL